MPDLPLADWTTEDLEALLAAKRKLEHPSLAARVSDAIGSPVEAGFKMLPRGWNARIGKATESALLTALEFAIRTMGKQATQPALPAATGAGLPEAAAFGRAQTTARPIPFRRKSQDWLHKGLVVATGTIGGAVGFAALPVELPASTVIILRSIADIARSEGHDLSLLETRLACLEVFALGGKAVSDDGSETGYWVVRSALSRQVAEAVTHIAGHGLDKNAPVIIRLVAKIAQRFSVVVGEEAAAMAVPVVGALTGGTVNYLFMQHFQDMAGGHFAVKRLEQKYGQDAVRQVYQSLAV
jgi:hypothetical protein